IALTPGRSARGLPLQKCHTAEISGADDCRRNARALAFLAVTVALMAVANAAARESPGCQITHGRGFFWPPSRAPPPPFDRLRAANRATPRPRPQILFSQF